MCVFYAAHLERPRAPVDKVPVEQIRVLRRRRAVDVKNLQHVEKLPVRVATNGEGLPWRNLQGRYTGSAIVSGITELSLQLLFPYAGRRERVIPLGGALRTRHSRAGGNPGGGAAGAAAEPSRSIREVTRGRIYYLCAGRPRKQNHEESVSDCSNDFYGETVTQRSA